MPHLVIEDNVPIPPKEGYGLPGKPRARTKWTILYDLEVGQSFTIPVSDRSAATATASRVSRETGRKFTSRREDKVTARIWRVE